MVLFEESQRRGGGFFFFLPFFFAGKKSQPNCSSQVLITVKGTVQGAQFTKATRKPSWESTEKGQESQNQPAKSI